MILPIQKVVSRQALARPNLFYLYWRFILNGSRTCRALFRRDAYSDSAEIAREIARRGIVMASSDRFLTEEGRRALAAASEEVLRISRRDDIRPIAEGRAENTNATKDFIIHLVSRDQEFFKDSPLVKLALDRKLLEIVSSYLGLYSRLHSISAWLNYPTQDDAKESQLWHRDPEDLKIIKVFIYLVDVSENYGPFSYIPETHPFGAAAEKAPRMTNRQRVLDAEMGSVFPPESWIKCTGPANTMILADTVGFHRGGKPLAGDRILITFTYTSGKPFVEPAFHMKEKPDWMTEKLQEYAL